MHIITKYLVLFLLSTSSCHIALSMGHPNQTLQAYSDHKSETCGICLEPNDRTSSSLSCHTAHTFHHTCLKQWKETSRTCPLCRQPIPLSITEKWTASLKDSDNTGIVATFGICAFILLTIIDYQKVYDQYTS
jgi:hypothetical protein